MLRACSSRQDKQAVECVHQGLYKYSHAKMLRLFKLATLGTLFARYKEEAENEGLSEDPVYRKNQELYASTMREFALKFDIS